MNNPKQPLTPAQAANRAAALCARCEQAPGDIREKLLKWGLSVAEASQVLRQLTEQGFIDERRFARAFVKDKKASPPRSSTKRQAPWMRIITVIALLNCCALNGAPLKPVSRVRHGLR